MENFSAKLEYQQPLTFLYSSRPEYPTSSDKAFIARDPDVGNEKRRLGYQTDGVCAIRSLSKRSVNRDPSFSKFKNRTLH